MFDLIKDRLNMLTMILRSLCILFFLSFHLSSFIAAQDISFTRSYPEVNITGQQMDLAWAGGLNAPQLSAIDLDRDGIDDLYIFDRAGNKQLTFINEGDANEPNYRFAPEYAARFPQDLADWVLLRDFDGDGYPDIFAHNGFVASGLRVYRARWENDLWYFDRYDFGKAVNIAHYPAPSGGESQIYISNIDYPAVDDIDCDGDLDLLTFNVVGGYVEFYANQSIERGYGQDSLIYILEDNCWGGIFETAISPTVMYADEPGECWTGLQQEEETVSPRHPGSTLLTFDATGDGLRELVLGDIAFTTVNMLINNGSCEVAYVNDQIPNYPEDNPVGLQLFPASFYLDVNTDGVSDFLAAPNEENAEDYECLWWYKNVGATHQPDLQLQTRSFLVENMIDLGSQAFPTYLDYNADGLMDLVVGNGSRFVPASTGDVRLVLFENTGTATQPVFTLVDDNYLNFNQFSNVTFNLTPTFGDLDGDGDVDALIGEQQGQLFHAINQAGPGNPVDFAPVTYGYMGIDIGIASAPQIKDMNQDGLPDLVIGERMGNINYFENIGTATSPMFDPDTEAGNNSSFLGEVDTRIPGFTTGYSTPAILDFGSECSIFTGSRIGVIEQYLTVSVLTDSFPLLDPFVGAQREGERTAPTFYDWDNDGFYEVIIGNQRGGLGYWNTNLTVEGLVNQTEPVERAPKVWLSPNPTTDFLQVQWEVRTRLEARLYNSQGQEMGSWKDQDPVFQISLQSWPKGVYYLQLTTNGSRVVRKIVKQ